MRSPWDLTCRLESLALMGTIRSEICKIILDMFPCLGFFKGYQIPSIWIPTDSNPNYRIPNLWIQLLFESFSYLVWIQSLVIMLSGLRSVGIQSSGIESVINEVLTPSSQSWHRVRKALITHFRQVRKWLRVTKQFLLIAGGGHILMNPFFMKSKIFIIFSFIECSEVKSIKNIFKN